MYASGYLTQHRFDSLNPCKCPSRYSRVRPYATKGQGRTFICLSLTPPAGVWLGSAFLVFALQQEAGVLELLGLSPGLTQGVQADAGDNQDGGAAEGQLGVDLQQHD